MYSMLGLTGELNLIKLKLIDTTAMKIFVSISRTMPCIMTLKHKPLFLSLMMKARKL